jgi:pSer/pThr/pTyr-binding forkhead associated (FHA) protein
MDKYPELSKSEKRVIRRLNPRQDPVEEDGAVGTHRLSQDPKQDRPSSPAGNHVTRPLKRLSPFRVMNHTDPGEYWLTVESTHRHIALPDAGRLVLGRFDPSGGIPPDIDLTYEDQDAQRISRRHAIIFGQHGQHTIEDLGSSVGVYLNGEQVDYGPTRPLQAGDHIRLGNTGLLYEAVPARILESARAEALRYRLRVTPTNRKLAISPYHKIVIGRIDPNIDFTPDIDLSSDGDAAQLVSRRHALIQWQKGRAYLEDLGSRFGTRLGGELLSPGQPVPLKPGDHIWLGGCVVAYDILVVG